MSRAMQWIMLLLVVCGVAWGVWAAAPALEGKDAVAVHFVPLDVMIDSGKTPMAAYQLEIQAPASVKIVGLEGGEPAAFRGAPYYDPAALMGDRIIVAAFSTASGLPSGRIRVARLHLMVSAGVAIDDLPRMTSKLTLATDAQGRSIPATLALRNFEGDKP